MCSPLSDNSDDGSLCEIIIFKKAHTIPLIAFLPDSPNIQSIFLMGPLLQLFNCFVVNLGEGCVSMNLYGDCKSVAPIVATGTLVLALHTNHWDPHPSPQLPKHVFSSGVDLQLC